jgi:hypothetical protein
MMEWREYVSQLLNNSSRFDGINLSFEDCGKTFEVPPIIKASILMLDKMLKMQGAFNILVFPERIQSIFIFGITKLLYNIVEGRIEQSYDPEKFAPGEKLRLGKAVAEFMRIETVNRKTNMRLRLADLEYSAPIEFFPLFQKTTAKRLSPDKVFSPEIKEAKEKLKSLQKKGDIIELLNDFKTHMDSSIVFVTSIISTKQLIDTCSLCGQKLKEAILIGQADFEGNVKNIGAGQLGGVPAVVLAADLYAANAMAEKGHPIQSIIIDGSNANALVSQLPELDKMLRHGKPVTCVTDIMNSFDLQPFLERGFNLWRWDETSLTDKLYDASPITSDRKIKLCAKRKISYITADGNEISTAIKLLYAHRKESQSTSAQILKLYGILFELALAALHETVPISEKQCLQIKTSLDECDLVLMREEPFLSPSSFSDYQTIINCLKKVSSQGYSLPKHDMLAETVLSNKELNYHRVAIIVPEKSDKNRIQQYWQVMCRRRSMSIIIDVLYPAEYYLAPCDKYFSTVVVGWLKRAIMRKILYSFNTPTYTVLMYDYEKRWKSYDSARWNAALNSTENRMTIEKSFATDVVINTSRFSHVENEPIEAPVADELTEIETVLRENKYHQFVSSGGKKAESETVEAVPVNYVGGYLAFYTTGHKIVSASNIIENDADKIETKLPNELRVGGFVVVREVDRDLVKEMADVILERSGMTDKRDVARKWKEALEIEMLFSTPEQIYEKLQAAGCTRGFGAVRSWLFDDEMIAPMSKTDLKYIADITENEVLKEMLDQIYDAAQIVKTAHQRAGMNLTQLLRSRIVEALKNYGDIDPFNIWEPIEMMVDGIGVVKILKIIDIGAPVVVNVSDTNRLIEEE